MSDAPLDSQTIDRQTMDVNIVCVGFGPATAGFLSTLAKTPDLESRAAPGMPLQVVCYERADDIGFGVSGVVTRARGIRATLPDLDPSQIPMAAPVVEEKLVYLLDPVGASRRSLAQRFADRLIRPFAGPKRAVELPYLPPFLRKEGGLVMSIGQFLQFVGGQVMASGTAQIWPGMPVAEVLVESGRVCGVRLADQGVDRDGHPRHRLSARHGRALRFDGGGRWAGGRGRTATGIPPRHSASGPRRCASEPRRCASIPRRCASGPRRCASESRT